MNLEPTISLCDAKSKLELILLDNNPSREIVNNLDFVKEVIPEVTMMIGFLHNHPHHHLDVWEHTLLALSKSVLDYEIRLTLLLHDIGKPYSYQDEEIRHFRGHPLVSSRMSYDILNRLEYSNEFINEVVFLVKYHDTPISDELIETNRELALKLYQVQVCDALAHHPDKLEKRICYLNDIGRKLEVEYKEKKMFK